LGIGWSFDIAMKGLNPRVLDTECSESGRLFNNGLETGLELGQKRLNVSLGFSIMTSFSHKSELLRAYTSMISTNI
jgi:hypothetical protein